MGEETANGMDMNVNVAAMGETPAEANVVKSGRGKEKTVEEQLQTLRDKMLRRKERILIRIAANDKKITAIQESNDKLREEITEADRTLATLGGGSSESET